MNRWVPGITINAHRNNDGKLLTNSRETTNISFYITDYQTKGQNKSHSMSAILAKGFAYHIQRKTYQDSLRDQQ